MVPHAYRKHPRHPCTTMHSRARGFCKKRDLAAGLGVMLVGKGGAADEGGGDSPSSSGFLQLVGVLGRGRCACLSLPPLIGAHEHVLESVLERELEKSLFSLPLN